LSEEDKEREKYILSGDALNDLKNNSKTKTIYSKKEGESIVKKVLKSLPEPEIESEDELIESLIGKDEEIEEILKPIMDVSELVDAPPKEPLKDSQEDSEKEIDFSVMSAKDIVTLVKEKTGKEITVSLKSKKSIIDHAKKIIYGGSIAIKYKKPIINKIESKKPTIDKIMPKEPIVEQIVPKKVIPEVSFEKNEFSNMSAREIVSLVKEKTGQDITVCLKSKIVVIKHARRILAEKGIVL
jgi:hypothetical protein